MSFLYVPVLSLFLNNPTLRTFVIFYIDFSLVFQLNFLFAFEFEALKLLSKVGVKFLVSYNTC